MAGLASFSCFIRCSTLPKPGMFNVGETSCNGYSTKPRWAKPGWGRVSSSVLEVCPSMCNMSKSSVRAPQWPVSRVRLCCSSMPCKVANRANGDREFWICTTAFIYCGWSCGPMGAVLYRWEREWSVVLGSAAISLIAYKTCWTGFDKLLPRPMKTDADILFFRRGLRGGFFARFSFVFKLAWAGH